MESSKASSGGPEVRWYFDFISPFAYLQHEMLKTVRMDHPEFTLNPVPVLFAGLLKHFEHKGPVEIEPKREVTYRHCQWIARRQGIPYRLPAVHPFNPLPFLRLSISRDNDPATIDRLFRHIWVESGDNPGFADLGTIETIPGFENAAAETAVQRVKDQLRLNTEEAISRGVFGVPTLEVDGQLFWGLDMTEMALESLTSW
jgi:2-hydroxychromene-2-carboxylate isomerase